MLLFLNVAQDLHDIIAILLPERTLAIGLLCMLFAIFHLIPYPAIGPHYRPRDFARYLLVYAVSGEEDRPETVLAEGWRQFVTLFETRVDKFLPDIFV